MDNAGISAETAFETLRALLTARPYSMWVSDAVAERVMGDRDGLYREDPPGSRRWRIRVRAGLQGAQRLGVLAHEAGHHFSRLEGWSESYKSAIAPEVDDWRGFPPDQQRGVIKEEVYAWRLGIALAVDRCGFRDRAALVQIGKAGFEKYRRRVDDCVDDFDAALLRVGEPAPSPG